MVGFAFALLLALVAFFLVRLSTHRPPTVELPQLDQSGSGDVGAPDASQEAVRRVEVTPETVQRVIERLARPDNYSRAVIIERFWSSGGGQTTAAVREAGGWSRIDTTAENTEQKHTISGDGKCWIWYGSERAVYSGAAAFTADEEENIPTYEDILLLDPSSIALADYRAFGDVNCIYVETVPDEFGYGGRYWIAVENGLLVASERVQDDFVVYRMAASAAERDRVTVEAFTLPDGTVLYDPSAKAEADGSPLL